MLIPKLKLISTFVVCYDLSWPISVLNKEKKVIIHKADVIQLKVVRNMYRVFKSLGFSFVFRKFQSLSFFPPGGYDPIRVI